MEGACRVCPRAYLLRLLRVSVRFSQSSRTQPMPTNSPQSWSIFDRRLCVSGALFFFWRRAGGSFWGNLDLRGRSVAAAPRGGAAAAQSISLGRLRRLVDRQPGPVDSVASLIRVCVTCQEHGLLCSPGPGGRRRSIGDVEGSIPLPDTPERWGPFTRASGCVLRPRSTCVGSIVIGGSGASTGGAGVGY